MDFSNYEEKPVYDQAHEHEEGERLTWVFVLVIISLFSVPWVVFFFLSYFKNQRKNKDNSMAWLSFFNLFSAGVFIGIIFCHILPEAQEKLAEIFPGHDTAGTLKILFFWFIVGWTFMLFIDRVYIRHSHGHSHSHSHSHSHLASRSPSGEHIHAADSLEDIAKDDIEQAKQKPGKDEAARPSSGSKRRLIFLSTIGAFGIHSLIEGIAIGTAQMADVNFLFFLALFCLHKSMDSVVVISQLLQANFSAKQNLGIMLSFTIITPIGILISSVALQEGSPFAATSGILEAVSGGILFYIAVLHLLVEELESEERIKAKLGTLVLSIGLVFIFENSGGHSH